MFGISGTELMIIAVFAFIIFGPDKIPEIARTVSKAVAMFKRAQDDMERTVKAEMYGLDPNVESMMSMLDPKKSAGTSGESSAKSASETSAMQGVVDDEEEDEE